MPVAEPVGTITVSTDAEIDATLAMLRELDKPKLKFADLRIWTREDPPRFVPFTLNTVQILLLESLCNEQGVSPQTPWLLKGLRPDILKSRQQGMSTFWLAFWYLRFYNLDYSQAVVLSHRAESTNRLWQTVETWEQDCRRRLPWLNAQRPLRYSNRKEITRADTGSSILIATAGMDDVATSGLITDVHRSETALWKAGAESQIVGILGALPEWGNLIEESTARGYTAHKDRWDAQEHARTAYFFPFTDTAEYRTRVPDGFKRTADEEKLRVVRILAGNWTEDAVPDEAVLWRRNKHAEYVKEGRPEATIQEFPLSPREAFQASSTDSYYPVDYLEALIEEFKHLKPVRVIKSGESGFGGLVEIYEEPVDGVMYTIGADEAEGHAQDNTHDDSAADGFRDDTREQVLAYTGRPDGEHFAHDLNGMSGFFNGAMIICERPPLGGSTNNKLKDLGANCYVHQSGPDSTAPELTKFGFPARAKDLRDSSLKALLCQAAAVWELYRDQGMSASDAAREVSCPVIKHALTLKQLLHYSNLPNHKRGGKGSHDDHNTSMTLVCWYMDNWTSGEMWQPVEDEDWQPAYAPQYSVR